MSIKYGDRLVSALTEIGAFDPHNAQPSDLSLLVGDLNRLWDEHDVMRSWLQLGQSEINPFSINFPFSKINAGSDALEADTASLTIQIPSAYKHLLIMGTGRTTALPVSGGQGEFMAGQFNGDTGANYEYMELYATANGIFKSSAVAQTFCGLGVFDTDNSPAGSASAFLTFIPHYNSSFWKVAYCLAGSPTFPAPDIQEINVISSVWKNTSPITSALLFPVAAIGGNIKAGTNVSVYGIL